MRHDLSATCRSPACVASVADVVATPLQRATAATHLIFAHVRPNAETLGIDLINDRDGPVLANLDGWVLTCCVVLG